MPHAGWGACRGCRTQHSCSCGASFSEVMPLRAMSCRYVGQSALWADAQTIATAEANTRKAAARPGARVCIEGRAGVGKRSLMADCSIVGPGRVRTRS